MVTEPKDNTPEDADRKIAGPGYRPDPAIIALADWLADPVSPARFPQANLRWRDDDGAGEIGLAGLTEARWLQHFARFAALPDNLPQPLALRYHGHQFQVYNPDIGDGRGFLFAQCRDRSGRLLDLGTKGTGTTPYSRRGDGRLTLKGAVRELLATKMLGALGVDTSRTFSIVETGEQLERGDEPSPARSAALVRLSHGHIRIGTFQRLLALEDRDAMAQLVDYCLKQFPGPPPPEDAPARSEPPVRLMHHVVERMADLAASYMTAGFVHGVLNTDNMNVSGESFDYGPWRFLPRWDARFTAAYFDQQGLYAFGRQPEAIHWNCGQMAVALRLLADAPPLIAALDRFAALYERAMARRWAWRLGVLSRGYEADRRLLAATEAELRTSGLSPDAWFTLARRGEGLGTEAAGLLSAYERVDRPGEQGEAPSLVIEEVERVWDAIAQDDDWQPLYELVHRIDAFAEAMGPPPRPAGHTQRSDRSHA